MNLRCVMICPREYDGVGEEEGSGGSLCGVVKGTFLSGLIADVLTLGAPFHV